MARGLVPKLPVAVERRISSEGLPEEIDRRSVFASCVQSPAEELAHFVRLTRPVPILGDAALRPRDRLVGSAG